MALEHWVWLTNLEISRRTMLQLLDRFGDPQRVFEAPEQDIRALRLDQHAESVLLQPRDLHTARAILATCAKKNISIVTMQDAAYPNRLRNIELPPVLLYVGGHMPSFDEEAAIAIVGTRNCSPSARRIAEQFAYELADKGMLVVSGMAKGIDCAANTGALEAGKRTVAVLGCGVDVCYPSENRPLYQQILERGCLISEYPPGTKPLGHHFPERNRIISGLCAGLLVVAAPHKSGSLITASQALEQGREIFVVPGGITDPEFFGSNTLIKEGAIPVTTPKDIVAYYYARFPDAFDARTISRYMDSGRRRRGAKRAAEPVVPREEVQSQEVIPAAPAPVVTKPTASVPETRSVKPAPAPKAQAKPPVSSAEKPVRQGVVRSLIDGLKTTHRPQRMYDLSVFTDMKTDGSDIPPVAAPKPVVSNPLPVSGHREIWQPPAEPPKESEELAAKRAKLTREQQVLVALLRTYPGETAHIDQLVNQSGFSAADALSYLTELELEGFVEALPGKRFHIV